MRYETLKQKTINLPVISLNYLRLLKGVDKSFTNQLSLWTNNGKLINLRRGLYILDDINRKITPSRLFFAYEIYKPSYVSMEYALAYYGLIPEKVVDITSVSTKKTAVFENKLGVFRYQHIVSRAFTGFVEAKDEQGFSYYIALPEKAVVDFIYLNLNKFKTDFRSMLFDSYRLQNVEDLSKKKLIEYAKLFRNDKLLKIVKEVK